MKRTIIYLFAVLVLLLGACSSGDGETKEENTSNNGSDGDKPTIAMSIINQEALFFTEMLKGAEAKAEELGVNFTVFNANNNEVDQYNSIENFISEGVDAIIINAIDAGALIPVVEKAEEEGIVIISVDSVIEHETVDSQIGVDNKESSKVLGEYFNEYAAENWGDKEPQLGVVGALNAAIQVIRQDSFLETVESGSNANLVNIVDGENVQEKALKAAENLLTADADLDAIFLAGEPAYIGAVSAVRSQGKEDSIKLFGWDLSPQVVQGIDDGFVEAVLHQHSDKYGEEAVKAAFDIINGEEVDSLIDVPATIVTKENIDEYRDLFE